jgi:hypothetical protein
VTRDQDGGPICANCFITDPANLETCIGCGRRRAVGRRTADGPLCPTCHALPVLTCFLCGDATPCGVSRTTGRPWCPTCQRRTATCSSCAHPAAIAAGTLTRPLCADCAPPPAWLDCPTCSDPDHPKPGQCERCLINRRLDEIMGPATGDLPAGLLALRNDIATAEHSITARRWLTKQPAVSVLADFATGRMPLTHEALDKLPKRQILEHLRLTLVAVGALPERDEELVRLEQALTDFLAAQQDTNRRKILHRYLIWNLLRRLRSRNNGRSTTRQQALRIRLHRRAAEAFLNWLDDHDLTLDTFGQPELEHWLGDPAGGYRYETATFIRWAHANKLTTANPQTKRWRGPVNALNDDRRWAIARQLLHDTTINTEDRLAGLLLLLYAQGPSAIGLLTTDQIRISDDAVTISFGRTPIRLPHPIDELARGVAARKGHANHRRGHPVTLAVPRRPARPPDQHRTTQAEAEPARHPTRPGPQHRTVPARHRNPRSNPGPHTRDQRQLRRPLATDLRRRLGGLRRRRQQPIASATSRSSRAHRRRAVTTPHEGHPDLPAPPSGPSSIQLVGRPTSIPTTEIGDVQKGPYPTEAVDPEFRPPTAARVSEWRRNPASGSAPRVDQWQAFGQFKYPTVPFSTPKPRSKRCATPNHQAGRPGPALTPSGGPTRTCSTGCPRSERLCARSRPEHPAPTAPRRRRAHIRGGYITRKMFRGTFSGTSRAGTPPKNSNAPTCAAHQEVWSIRRTGRTNIIREHANTITNACTTCRIPVAGSIQAPSRP